MGLNMLVSCESDSAISTTIRDSLGNFNSLAKASNLGLNKNQLSAAVKQSLLKPIEYVESPPGFGYSIQESLKAKYTVLRPEEDKSTAVQVAGTPSTVKSLNGTKGGGGACLPPAKIVLYPREKVQIGWGNAKKWSVGSGMSNLGNTCYMNSTLQALFHIPSFATWLLSDVEHRNRCEEICGSQNSCIICSMASVLQSTQSSMYPTKPVQIHSKLRQICRHLVNGHQEDAHEFLRYLMESMEKAFIFRFKNHKDFEQYTKETTPINQILGGYLRTSVKCLSCHYESVTFQHFEDLLLDIRRVNTIEEALRNHFERERLEDMDYTCASCKKKVSATKQFSLERAPVALCIQLKRFSGINGKINKHIHIAQEIDFSQYSSKDVKNSQLKYRLVSMITHLGATPQCGHYTAIGCVQDGSYYQFDDSVVRPTSIKDLPNANPYIIFYEMISAKQLTSVANNENNNNNTKRTETSTQFIGPMMPATATNQSTKPVLTQINNLAIKRAYGPASNGSGDNRKLMTVCSNQPPKRIIDTTTALTSSSLTLSPLASSLAAVKSSTTSGNLSNETLTNNVTLIKVENTVSNTASSLVRPMLPSTLQIKQQSPTKRIIEKTNKTFSETSTKKLDDCRSSVDSDSETEFPSTLKLPALPSMPQLKSHSPTTPTIDENSKVFNGNHTAVIEEVQNIVRRTSETSDISTLLNVPKTLPNGSQDKDKLHSPLTQKNEEIKKSHSPKPSPDPRESSENQPKTLSLLPIKSSVQANPFSRANHNSTKNIKHKTNGYSSNDQRNANSKSSNGYASSNQRGSLVPYAFNEDSDSNNEERKSPPIVKTKAGLFQVTKNKTNGTSSNWNAVEQRLPWLSSNVSNSGGRVPSLSTWNGCSSFLEDEIAADQRAQRKRKLDNDYDADLDCGRMKKRRRLVSNTVRDNPNYNAFQEHQNQQHRDSNRYRRSGHGGNIGHFFNQSYRFQKCYNKRKY